MKVALHKRDLPIYMFFRSKFVFGMDENAGTGLLAFNEKWVLCRREGTLLYNDGATMS